MASNIDPSSANFSHQSSNIFNFTPIELQTFADLVTAVVIPVSLLIAIISTWLVTRAAWETARAETFRSLRSSFAELRAQEPAGIFTTDKVPAIDSPEFRKMVAYWRQSFDEWFITQKLCKRNFGVLWKDYYKEAIRLSAKSPAMFAVLLYTVSATSAQKNPMDRCFLREIIKLVNSEYVSKGVKLACKLKFPIPTGFGLEKYK